MLLQQNQTVRDDVFVSNIEPVTHSIVLNKPDALLLKDNATSVITYWFIDCGFYGFTNDYNFNYKFTDVGKEHVVEALIVGSYDKVHIKTSFILYFKIYILFIFSHFLWFWK